MSHGKPGGKREGDNMSPMKKKPMVMMPTEELDNDITSPVSSAMLAQQNGPDMFIQSSMKEAVSSILIP